MLTLRFFQCGSLRFDPAVFVPELPRGTKVEGPVLCCLLENDGHRILVDTGCHPLVVRSPEEAWGGLTKAFYPLVTPADLVTEQLWRVGIDPDAIDTVVCTHLHMDHCGCNSRFPHAQILVHVAEWALVQDPALEGKGYFRRDWDHPLNYVQVQDGSDLFGDGRAVLRHLPGHTPGSVGVVAELARKGPVVLASDAVPVTANLDGPIPRNTADPEQFARTAQRLKEYQKDGATIICGHDPEQAASLPPPEEVWE